MIEADAHSVVVHSMEPFAKISDGGIKAHWAEVVSVGKEVSDVKEGDWILIDDGRWSNIVFEEGEEMEVIPYPTPVHMLIGRAVFPGLDEIFE